MAYSYITIAQLRAALYQRLQDTAGVSTPVAEANAYIIEALRVLAAQTSIWNTDYLFDFAPRDTWKSLNIADSPRERTVTDTDIYIQMEMMLLEPPSGGTWTGTAQFNITNLSNALQYRRDELLQASMANVVNFSQPSPVSGNRTSLPDTLLNLRRVRWIPTVDTPYALWREDRKSANAYGDLLSLNPGPPESWMITATQPLEFECSSTPNVPGTWDMLAMESGVTLAPPTANVLGLPNDWCWVAQYGALADVLSNSPEGADPARAKYCLQRYAQGMKAMAALPWLISATVSNLPVDTPSFEEADAYAQNWEQTWPSDDPQIVVGGVDLIALAPFVTVSTPPNPVVSSVLTVVGNAPIPTSDGDEIQLSRDGVDAVLNYAQHIATFKRGGSDFAATLPLFEQFESYCRSVNRRYAALGIFRPEMILEGNRSEDIDPRLAPEVKNG